MVSNASPLIYLAKVGRISILKELFQEIMIPHEVLNETCGLQDSPDAIVISSAVKEGWIQSIDITNKDAALIAKSSGIDFGEATAILLAKEKNALLLIDDKMGRSAAEILGVRCLGTLGVLLQALSNSNLNFSDFIATLDQMIDLGFRLDSKVYGQVLKIARGISDNI